MVLYALLCVPEPTEIVVMAGARFRQMGGHNEFRNPP